ncbi:hypothetical protein KC319_g23328, partial [Hortaea werneckii]
MLSSLLNPEQQQQSPNNATPSQPSTPGPQYSESASQSPANSMAASAMTMSAMGMNMNGDEHRPDLPRPYK